MSMTSELKPCPFCGGEAVTELCGKGKFAHWCVWCDCNVLRQDFKTEAEAIEAWNTRAERTCRMVKPDWGGPKCRDKVCSECGVLFRTWGEKYCSHCGAKVVEHD